MAGIDVGGGGGGRRKLDSEINMIPFIDLLMVTISFLLITAVWSQMARLNADAQVPGPPDPDKPIEEKEPEKILHVEMRQPDKFTLIWRQGAQVVNSVDVPRRETVETDKAGTKTVRFPDLAEKIEQEWKASGSHRDSSDPKQDQAVLHTDNEAPYYQIIGVIDAIYKPARPLTTAGRTELIPAFNVTFSIN